jgi:hypothetical protein
MMDEESSAFEDRSRAHDLEFGLPKRDASVFACRAARANAIATTNCMVWTRFMAESIQFFRSFAKKVENCDAAEICFVPAGSSI